jgi:hypothetical protein
MGDLSPSKGVPQSSSPPPSVAAKGSGSPSRPRRLAKDNDDTVKQEDGDVLDESGEAEASLGDMPGIDLAK